MTKNNNIEQSSNNPTNPTYKQNNKMSSKMQKRIMLRSELRSAFSENNPQISSIKSTKIGLTVFSLGCLATALYGYMNDKPSDDRIANGIGGIGLVALAGAAVAQSTENAKKDLIVERTVRKSTHASHEAKKAVDSYARGKETFSRALITGTEGAFGFAAGLEVAKAATVAAMSSIPEALSGIDAKTMAVAGAIIATGELFKQSKDWENSKRVKKALGKSLPENTTCIVSKKPSICAAQALKIQHEK